MNLVDRLRRYLSGQHEPDRDQFLPDISSSSPLASILEAERDRWFVWVPVAFGAGIAVYFALPQEPSLLTCLVPACAACACRYVWRQGLGALLLGGLFVMAAFGFATGKLRTEWVRAPVLEKPLRFVEVRGWLETIAPRQPKGARLTVRVVTLGKLTNAQRPRRVRITTHDRDPRLHAGLAIKVRASLTPPPRPALPGGYDFARRAWFVGLGAIGFARQRVEIDSSIGQAPLSLRIAAMVQRVRQRISERIARALPGETGGIATALITGERGGISPTTLEAFRSAGLVHVLAISGLHMSIMAGTVFLLVRLLFASLPGVALKHPIKKWAAVAAMVAAFMYLLVSGASYSTQRACIMICIMFAAVLLDRRAIALRNVALAAVVLLIAFPESLFDISFQMSFAAVVALVSIYETWRARRDRQPERPPMGWLMGGVMVIVGIAATTIIASAAVAPFGLYHFHQSQQFAVLGNLIALPVVNIVVMPMALLTLLAMPFGLEAGPLNVMALGINFVVTCAVWVASLPGATLRVPALPDSALVFIVLGGLWLLLWRTRWRLLGVAPIGLGLAMVPTLIRPDIYVGREGRAIMVRDASAKLQALTFRGKGFEVSRWLEADGDARAARDAINRSLFLCDATGCSVRKTKAPLTVSWHPAGLRDDCKRARILILRYARKGGCVGPELIIDRTSLIKHGNHAIFIGQTGLRLDTVSQSRGKRPWIKFLPLKARRSETKHEVKARLKRNVTPRSQNQWQTKRSRKPAPRSDVGALPVPRQVQ